MKSNTITIIGHFAIILLASLFFGCTRSKKLKVVTCEFKGIGATVQFTIRDDKCEQTYTPYNLNDPLYQNLKPTTRSLEECLKSIGLLESHNREDQTKQNLQIKVAGLTPDSEDKSKCITVTHEE